MGGLSGCRCGGGRAEPSVPDRLLQLARREAGAARSTSATPIRSMPARCRTLRHSLQGPLLCLWNHGNGRCPTGIFRGSGPRSGGLEEVGGALTPPTTDKRYHYWRRKLRCTKAGFTSITDGRSGAGEIRTAGGGERSGRRPYNVVGVKLVDCETNVSPLTRFLPRRRRPVVLFYAGTLPIARRGSMPGGLVVDRLLDMTRLAGDCRVVVRARYDWTLYEAKRRMVFMARVWTGTRSRGRAS
jgi:hypothetical protein